MTKIKNKEEKENHLIEEMFKLGAHFGYNKSRRHPSVKSYIFTTKNKVDIIDLEKTDNLLVEAKNFVKKLGEERKQILFVGTKAEAKKIVQENAQEINFPFVNTRWIGGTFTNFSEIKKRIDRLETLRKEKVGGLLDKYTKKEYLVIDEEIKKLETFFSGIVIMQKLPEAILVVDVKHEEIAVTEANKVRIPVIGIANSDCDIKNIDYPIVANDSSASSIEFFIKELIKSYKEGQENPVSKDQKDIKKENKTADFLETNIE